MVKLKSRHLYEREGQSMFKNLLGKQSFFRKQKVQKQHAAKRQWFLLLSFCEPMSTIQCLKCASECSPWSKKALANIDINTFRQRNFFQSKGIDQTQKAIWGLEWVPRIAFQKSPLSNRASKSNTNYDSTGDPPKTQPKYGRKRHSKSTQCFSFQQKSSWWESPRSGNANQKWMFLLLYSISGNRWKCLHKSVNNSNKALQAFLRKFLPKKDTYPPVFCWVEKTSSFVGWIFGCFLKNASSAENVVLEWLRRQIFNFLVF